MSKIFGVSEQGVVSEDPVRHTIAIVQHHTTSHFSDSVLEKSKEKSVGIPRLNLMFTSVYIKAPMLPQPNSPALQHQFRPWVPIRWCGRQDITSTGQTGQISFTELTSFPAPASAAPVLNEPPSRSH
jgi:hypothetical protein